MKKGLITIIIVVLVLVIGTGGVLGWGYYNAKTDKTYANKANDLVQSYKSKYPNDYFQKQFSQTFDDQTKIKTVRDSLDQAKTEAQNDLNALNATKSSKRVAAEQKDAQDYFNITINDINTAIFYADYIKSALTMSTELQTISNSTDINSAIAAANGDTGAQEAAANRYDAAIAILNKGIKDMDALSVPDTLKDYNNSIKKVLNDELQLLVQISAALKAGNMDLVDSYYAQLTALVQTEAPLYTPTEISKTLISADDQKKLNDIPDRLTTDATNLTNKKFAF